MFTGLVEAVGQVRGLSPMPGGLRLSVNAPLARELREGDSLAVNGVCLTVTEVADEHAAFDIGPETARVTALGALRPGASVNLERALRADARVGGHFVQGHVDTTGVLVGIRPADDFVWVSCAYPAEHAPYLIEKGAVAVDGISLTVAVLSDGRFDVQVIPFTWTHTNLSTRAIGDSVNLEFDLLGKYAVRAAERAAGRPIPSLP